MERRTTLLALGLTLAATGALARTVTRTAHFTAHTAASVNDPITGAANCPLGLPRTHPEWERGELQTIVRDGYALEHDGVDKIALWVCEHLTREEASGTHAQRSNRFFAEPEIPLGQRAELVDYRGSGYDRGHLAAAGNQTQNQRLQDETFSLANMIPQDPRNNRGIWKDLEDQVRTWAKTFGDVYVISAGFLYDPAEENPATADGVLEYEVVGPGEVAVPTHLYKIVAYSDGTKWHALAFVLENRPYAGPDRTFPPLQRSVRWIEERAGLNFFPDIPSADADALESSVEALWQ